MTMGSRGGKRSRRDGSILYQLMTRCLKRPASDTLSVERVIKGADSLQSFLKKHGEAAQQLDVVDFVTLSEKDQQWEQVADLRWFCYQILKQIGPLWKESLVLALAMNEQQDLTEAVECYEKWIAFMVDRLRVEEAISEEPLLNGLQIQQRALPKARGEAFKQILKAQEEWQVRHGYSGGVGSSNREARLVDYLRDTFPEYAGPTR